LAKFGTVIRRNSRRLLARLQQAINAGGPVEELWELEASTLGLTDGETYHYWFEMDNRSPGGTGRIQTTDPLALVVDYRLYAPANPSITGVVALTAVGENPARSAAGIRRRDRRVC
jgi:hypothetical protein